MKNKMNSKIMVKNKVAGGRKVSMDLGVIRKHMIKDCVILAIIINSGIHKNKLEDAIIKGVAKIDIRTRKAFDNSIKEFLYGILKNEEFDKYVTECYYITHSYIDDDLLKFVILYKLVNKIDKLYNKFIISDAEKVGYVNRVIFLHEKLDITNVIKRRLTRISEKLKNIPICEINNIQLQFIGKINRALYVSLNKKDNCVVAVEELLDETINTYTAHNIRFSARKDEPKIVKVKAMCPQENNHIANLLLTGIKMVMNDELGDNNMTTTQKDTVIDERILIHELQKVIEERLSSCTLVKDFINSTHGVNDRQYYINTIIEQFKKEYTGKIVISDYITPDICRDMGKYISDNFDFSNDVQFALAMAVLIRNYMQAIITVYENYYCDRKPNINFITVNQLVEYIKESLKVDLISGLDMYVRLLEQQLLVERNDDLNLENLIINLNQNLYETMKTYINQGEEDADLCATIKTVICSFIQEGRIRQINVFNFIDDITVKIYSQYARTMFCTKEDIEEINYFIEKYDKSKVYTTIVDKLTRIVEANNHYAPFALANVMFEGTTCESLMQLVKNYVKDNFICENEFEIMLAEKAILTKLIHPLLCEMSNEPNSIKGESVDRDLAYTKAFIDSMYTFLKGRYGKVYPHFENGLINVIGYNKYRHDVLFRKLFCLKHIKDNKIKIIDFISYALI